MDEYISKNKIVQDIEEEIGISNMALDEDVWFNRGLKTALNYIKKIPATDIQPAKRGRWEYEHYNELIECYEANCSECGYESTDKYHITSNHRYCEHCGARMGGEQND